MKPIVVYIKGYNISLAIEGELNFITDGPWCKVFHHSTEKWIIGMFIKPTIASMFAALAPLR